MLQEFLSRPFLLWIALAVVFGLLEVTVPAFGFLFSALASLLVAIIAFLTPDWKIQMIAFGVSLLVGIFVFRPRWIAKFQGKHKILSRTEALVGKRGVVSILSDPAHGPGRILVNGQDWAAQSKVRIEPGKTVVIEGSDGLILNVREI